jgi:hypothetical protein
MKLRFSFPVAFALLLASLTSTILHAQAVGEITGTVTDPTGAVVPSASITATNVSTGVSQTTLSTAAGNYTLARLPVGTYTVTAEAKGFKKGLANSITLDVSQQREVDFTLALEGVTATVEVSAAPPLINTTNATLAQVVSSEQVENLPLNGRNIEGLMTMQPGIVPYTGNMGWMSGELAGNGNRGETAVGTLDGADISDAEMGTSSLRISISMPLRNSRSSKTITPPNMGRAPEPSPRS